MKLTRFVNFLAEIRDEPERKLNFFLDEKPDELFYEIGQELKSLVQFIDITNVLTDTGIVTEQSMWREFLYRLNRKFFPPVYPDKEFRSFLKTFNDKCELTRILVELSPQTLSRFLAKVFPEDPRLVLSLRRKLHAPFKILVHRLLFHCTSRQFFDRLNHVNSLKESILGADTAAAQFLKAPNSEGRDNLLEHLQACRDACERIRERRNTHGISLQLTLRIMVINAIVGRLRILVCLLSSSRRDEITLEVARLLQSIVVLEAESSRLRPLFWEYVELVSYEITEHTGRKGESYIQRNVGGLAKMLKKGLYGGAIVGLLSFLKPMLAEANLPPFVEAVGFSLLYSIIFLVIYFLGGVLATKQPAMTASTLANELDGARPSTKFLWEVSNLIRDTFRSQFLAIFGNVVLALPVASLVYGGLVWANIYTFKAEKASYLIKSLHPVFSFSLFYAAITGVCLALSGVAAGAIRNWFIFNRIDLRITRKSVFVDTFGRQRVEKWGDFIDKHLEGLAGNVSLGFLLGFLSTASSVFGLPINIRHITFASAQVGTALSQPDTVYDPMYLAVILLGVGLIGVINLAVSFSITFFVAFKSRKLNFDQGKGLLRICITRLFREPFRFFLAAES